jgi:mitochondrial ATPase complex subunit ATP10
MAESWSLPYLDAFGAAKNIPVYEVWVINDFLFAG